MQVNNSASVRGASVSNDMSSVSRGQQTVGVKKKSFGQKLAGIAKGVAQVGLGVVGNVVPGGNILTQALGSALGSGGNFGDTPGLSGGDMMQKMAAMNMQFLALQEATQMESRKFQTLSNASKARNDVAMNAIRNLK